MSYPSEIDALPLEDRPFQLDSHGPVFILGCPRSGTTFLSKCISSITGYREYVGVLAPPRLMHFIGSSTSHKYQEDMMLIIRDIFWQSFWRDEYFKTRKIQFLNKNLTKIWQILKRPSMRDLVFCYKEPFLCFAAKQFAEHFPNSKFIHIIRDGRDIADSMCRTYGDALTDETLKSDILCMNKVSEIGKWNRKGEFNYPWYIDTINYDMYRSLSPYGRYAWLWKEMTIRSMELKEHIAPNRYLEVRYEDIALNPIKESKRIEKFLGRKTEKNFERNLKKIHSKSLKISQRNQSAENLNEAMQVAGDLLIKLGYIN